MNVDAGLQPVFAAIASEVDYVEPESTGAAAGKIAEDLGMTTAAVNRAARTLALRGLVVDTGSAMKKRGRQWHWIDAPKTEGGMRSKPGASTVWGLPKAVAADVEERGADAVFADSEKPAMKSNPGFYVWALAVGSSEPLTSEGPWGPYDSLTRAAQFARIGATEGIHDRVVSRGKDPKSASFTIVRRYQAKTGKSLL